MRKAGEERSSLVSFRREIERRRDDIDAVGIWYVPWNTELAIMGAFFPECKIRHVYIRTTILSDTWKVANDYSRQIRMVSRTGTHMPKLICTELWLISRLELFVPDWYPSYSTLGRSFFPAGTLSTSTDKIFRGVLFAFIDPSGM